MSTKNSPIEKLVKEVIKKKPKINTFVDKMPKTQPKVSIPKVSIPKVSIPKVSTKISTPETSINDSITFTGSVETVSPAKSTISNINEEISLKYLVSKIFSNKTIKWAIILTLLLVGVYFYLKTHKKEEKEDNDNFRLEKDNIIDIQEQHIAKLTEQQEQYRKELYAIGLQNKANFQQVEHMLNNMKTDITEMKNNHKKPQKKVSFEKNVQDNLQEQNDNINNNDIHNNDIHNNDIHNNECEIIISEDENIAEHELTTDELNAINEQLNDINV
jgi:hypothetical protein